MRIFNLDDCCAEVGEESSTVWSSQHSGKVNNSNVGKRSLHLLLTQPSLLRVVFERVMAPIIPPVEDVEVSFVIPCLNEARTLPFVLREITSSFDNTGLCYETVVADNGSTDESIDIATKFGARVVQVAERGYGAALLGGIKSAQGKYVVMGDADGSYTFGDAATMIPKLRQGTDIVMGNRFSGGISDGAMPWLHRYVGNPVLSFLGRLLFRVKVRDFHCGLRAFNRAKIEALQLTSSGMEFASEMIVAASQQRYTIDEVGVTLKKDLRDRPPHLKTWRDGWRHLRFLFAYSPSWVFLVPAVSTASVSLVVLGLSLFGPIEIGAIELSYKTAILASSAMTVSLVGSWSFFIAQALVRRRVQSTKYVTELLGTLSLAVLLLGVFLVFSHLRKWSAADFGDQPLGESLLEFVVAGFCLSAGAISFFMSMLLGVVRTKS